MALHQVEVNGEAIIIGGNGALVASKSEPGAWHIVKLVGVERVCDCKSFRYRGANCRHVRAVEQHERERKVAKVENNRDTAPLAGPAIDPPLFPERKPWVRPEPKTFEQLFGQYVA